MRLFAGITYICSTCMYVVVCVCVCVCMYVCECVYVCVCICMYIYSPFTHFMWIAVRADVTEAWRGNGVHSQLLELLWDFPHFQVRLLSVGTHCFFLSWSHRTVFDSWLFSADPFLANVAVIVFIYYTSVVRNRLIFLLLVKIFKWWRYYCLSVGHRQHVDALHHTAPALLSARVRLAAVLLRPRHHVLGGRVGPDHRA